MGDRAQLALAKEAQPSGGADPQVPHSVLVNAKDRVVGEPLLGREDLEPTVLE